MIMIMASFDVEAEGITASLMDLANQRYDNERECFYVICMLLLATESVCVIERERNASQYESTLRFMKERIVQEAIYEIECVIDREEKKTTETNKGMGGVKFPQMPSGFQ
ncbi:hypothetical protein VNO78_17882 [Psophocarpus tetragonolobus]|uniref:Uncharacterized protein n=1 Tax=Psophocarpus tetragonolobus TaxID=3891 RepID=A0AAN9SJK4_PSOTE